jgi:hypothetical protein
MKSVSFIVTFLPPMTKLTVGSVVVLRMVFAKLVAALFFLFAMIVTSLS